MTTRIFGAVPTATLRRRPSRVMVWLRAVLSAVVAGSVTVAAAHAGLVELTSRPSGDTIDWHSSVRPVR
jgi:hypothetical protein